MSIFLARVSSTYIWPKQQDIGPHSEHNAA